MGAEERDEFLIVREREETHDLGCVTIAIPQFWFEFEEDASQSQICIYGNEISTEESVRIRRDAYNIPGCDVAIGCIDALWARRR